MWGSVDKDVENREGSSYHPEPESRKRGSELETPGLQGVCAHGRRHQAGERNVVGTCRKEDSIEGEVTRAGDPGKRRCLPKASCCVHRPPSELCRLSPAGVGRRDGYRERKNHSGTQARWTAQGAESGGFVSSG